MADSETEHEKEDVLDLLDLPALRHKARELAKRMQLPADSADDAVQSALLKILQHHGRVPGLTDPLRAQRYFLIVLRNQMAHEQLERRATLEAPDLADLAVSGTLSSLDEADVEAILLRALEALPEKHRRFAQLHFVRGESNEEVMKALGLTSLGSYRQLSAATIRLLRDAVRDALAATHMESA